VLYVCVCVCVCVCSYAVKSKSIDFWLPVTLVILTNYRRWLSLWSVRCNSVFTNMFTSEASVHVCVLTHGNTFIDTYCTPYARLWVSAYTRNGCYKLTIINSLDYYIILYGNSKQARLYHRYYFSNHVGSCNRQKIFVHRDSHSAGASVGSPVWVRGTGLFSEEKPVVAVITIVALAVIIILTWRFIALAEISSWRRRNQKPDKTRRANKL